MESSKKQAMQLVVNGMLLSLRQLRRDLDLLECFDKSLPVSRVKHDLTDVVYGVYDIRNIVDEL